MNPMRPLKLYLKTTILTSIITILMFAVALVFVSVRIAGLVRGKEKDLARLQATEFADHIGNLPNPKDASVLNQLANLIDNTQPTLTSVRIWQRGETNDFSQMVSSDDSPPPAQAIPATNQSALLQNQRTESTFENSANQKTVFRAFAPLQEKNGKIFGAVEISQTLDSPWTIAADYAQSEAGVAAVTIAMLTLGTFFLFRYFVYRPLKILLDAMSQAETGNLAVQAPIFADDELGQLATKFNRMVSSLNVMTKEREAYQDALHERVREATEELQNKNEQLTEANRELWRVSRRLTEVERLAAAGQTAAQFAHEVGTPLNLISGHVQLLRLQTKGENISRLDVISQQIERIERIVRSTLDRTRIAKGEREAINVNEILRRTLEATKPLFDERNIELTTRMDEDLPEILGDADHLQQTFINLINNALDAMPERGRLHVTTRFEAEKNSVTIDFDDNGVGMTEEVRAKIFDVLYTTKGRRGTGLGLTVVKQIMQEHEGEIEVESKIGKGTRFRLRFPAAN